MKEVTDPIEQAKAVDKARLRRLVCQDSLDIRELMRSSNLRLRLRDTWRDRVDARPEMVALIAGASQRLKRKRPNAVITVGDIAQKGCGQIRYGTVTRFMDAADTAEFVTRARWDTGMLTTLEPLPPEWYWADWPRFEESIGPVWLDRRLMGRFPDGRGRVEEQRLTAGAMLSGDSIARLVKRTWDRLKQRKRVTWDKVWHHVDGRRVRVKRARWFDAEAGRKVEVVFRPVRKLWPLRAEKLIRVREARLDIRKPTSPKYEERYDVLLDGECGIRVRKHLLEYEAHHSSHLGGLDADLSYVTVDNVGHFAPASAVLDPPATWAWLKALDDTARKLGIPLKALFVDRSILRVLKAASGASRKDRLWRKLRRSPGHDSHVHVRIGTSARWSGRDTDQIMKALGIGSAK